MIRFLDILISIIGLLLFSPFLIIFFIIVWFDTGSSFFIQQRVGLNLKNFNLVKFRTMKIGTKSKGTHLISKSNITHIGYFLRKYKIDEMPQLFNVLIGDMSIVGPRPCLTNQKRLIRERKKRGIFKVKPGITGFAQIKGINMAEPILLSKTDKIMIQNKINIINYFQYILLTFFLIINNSK
jgi:lipopolysaccharide/colanic/teichoic acid biosynthesis glycosyltransferase